MVSLYIIVVGALVVCCAGTIALVVTACWSSLVRSGVIRLCGWCDEGVRVQSHVPVRIGHTTLQLSVLLPSLPQIICITVSTINPVIVKTIAPDEAGGRVNPGL